MFKNPSSRFEQLNHLRDKCQEGKIILRKRKEALALGGKDDKETVGEKEAIKYYFSIW